MDPSLFLADPDELSVAALSEELSVKHNVHERKDKIYQYIKQEIVFREKERSRLPGEKRMRGDGQERACTNISHLSIGKHSSRYVLTPV